MSLLAPGSMRLGRILGVPVALHWSFLGVLFALALLALDAPARGGRPAGLGLLGSALGALLLHELGHALAARLAGVRVGGVVLHLFGGLTLLDPRTLKGMREVAAGAGGPLVNLACGLLALLPEEGLARFGQMNLLFGGLNLLPAWPLDGGRILRALLALRVGRVRATLAAGLAGVVVQALAFLGVLLFLPLPLLLIPVYLAVVGVRAMQAEIAAELEARLAGPDGAAAAEAPAPPPMAGEDEECPSLARRLRRFRGSLAEFLKSRR